MPGTEAWVLGPVAACQQLTFSAARAQLLPASAQVALLAAQRCILCHFLAAAHSRPQCGVAPYGQLAISGWAL